MERTFKLHKYQDLSGVRMTNLFIDLHTFLFYHDQISVDAHMETFGATHQSFPLFNCRLSSDHPGREKFETRKPAEMEQR